MENALLESWHDELEVQECKITFGLDFLFSNYKGSLLLLEVY